MTEEVPVQPPTNGSIARDDVERLIEEFRELEAHPGAPDGESYVWGKAAGELEALLQE